MMNELILLAILNIENEEDQIFMADIYTDYSPLMYKNAFEYVENNYDAEDIVQSVFINLIKKIPVLKKLERHALIAYIVYSIKNTSINFIKNRNRNSESIFLYEDDEDINDIRDDADTPEEIILEKYRNEIILAAFEQLKPKYQFIIESKYFHKMSDNDIAKILETTPENVRKCLERARKAMKKILEREHDFNELR